MPTELRNPDAIRELLLGDAEAHTELLDVLERDGPDALGLWVDDPASPGNLVAVRWGSGPLGMSNRVDVRAGRVGGLPACLDALPRGRGSFTIRCPFWVAPALESVFRVEIVGPVARYRLEPGALRAHPAARQAVELKSDDLEMLAFAFPRAAREAPHRALVFDDALVAVAVTTATAEGYARFGVHVVEEHRGRGFGTGVATALAAALQETGRIPTAEVFLGDETSVRMVEHLGMVQTDAAMQLDAVGRLAPGRD